MKKKNLKILFISHSSQKGGSERSMLELLSDLKSKNVSCHVLLPTSGPLEDELKKNSISYSIVPYRWWTLNKEKDCKSTIEDIVKQSFFVMNEIEKIGPDLIYTNTSVVNVGAIVAKELNIPHIWHIREFGEKDHNMKFILEEKDRFQYIDTNSDFVIFNSKSIEQYYKSFSLFNKSEVVYNDVNVCDSEENIEHEKIFKRSDSLHLIIVGSIHEGKGQMDAILAVSELKKQGIDVELAIIGGVSDEKYGKDINDAVVKNDLADNVCMAGYQDNPFGAIKSADILLTCSKNEAFGRVTVEGMLAKKPVIGTESGGTKELILEGENGFLYEPGNYMQLTEKIIMLQKDARKRDEMGNLGYEFAIRNFSREKYSGRIRDIMHLLNDKKSKASISDLFCLAKINLVTKIIEKKDQEIEQKKHEIEQKNEELYEIRSSLRWKIPNYLYKQYKKRIKKFIPKRLFRIKDEVISNFHEKPQNQVGTVEVNEAELVQFKQLVKSCGGKTNVDVSVIMATYNRAHILKELLHHWKKIDANTSCKYELIFSDDGSDDSTLEVLRDFKDLPIVILENKHHGASSARNHAVEKAKGELLIFTGDDIFPETDFIEKHWEYYKKHGQRMATLGRIEWKDGIRKTYLMKHITEVGCEQFGFVGLKEYSTVDFRHFYTSNISISSALIRALGRTFDMNFTRYGFEDVELGYRLARKGIGIFYAPDILVYHDHEYSDVNRFCDRQRVAGEMLATFKRIHPNLSQAEIGFDFESFYSALDEYNDRKFPDVVSFVGVWFLFGMKPVARLCEMIIEYRDFKYVRKLCSKIYSWLFVFSFYEGFARATYPNLSIKKSKLFSFRYSVRNNFIAIVRSIIFTKFRNVDGGRYGQPKNSIWIQVNLENGRLLNDYKRICKQLLPAIVVSNNPCPTPLEYESYIYNPESEETAMDSASFSNAAFCLVNNCLDFIITSNDLDSWPILSAKDIMSSVIFSNKYKSIGDFIKCKGVAAGKFIRLKSNETENKKINISEKMRELYTKGGYLYCGKVKKIKKRDWNADEKRKKIRPVVFVFPAFMAVGGVERNTVEVMRHLKNKYDFVVVTWENHTKEAGSLFHQLKDICIAYYDFAQTIEIDFYLENLKKLRNIYSPDVVWVPNSNPWYFDNLIEIRSIFSECVMIAQDAYDAEHGWIAHYNRSGMNRYDKYIAVNEKIRDKFISKFNIPKNKIELIYSAINENNIKQYNSKPFDRNEISKKFGLNPSKKQFAFIGRLVEQKQPLEFIKMAKMILDEHDDVNFVIVGDGVLGPRVDRLIVELGLGDRIKRIKFIENLYPFTKSIDGLVVTSLYEGLPIVSIEAMCLGVPILTTDVGDLPLFVKSADIGVVSNGFDASSLVIAFEEFLEKISYHKEKATADKDRFLDFFSSKRAAELTERCFLNNSSKKTYTENVAHYEEQDYPLVSVIIPSYNHRDYIENAVKSVLGQTYENLELIVIDDGSKDESVEFLESIIDKRFTLVKQKNAGAHNAINRGLNMAKGKYLAILNSDDIFHPDRIRQCVNLMESDPETGLVCTWIQCIDSSGEYLDIKKGWSNMTPWPLKNEEYADKIKNDFYQNLFVSNFISTTSNMVFRKDVFERIGGMRNLRFVHDWDFALRVIQEFNCKMIEKPLMQYRLHLKNTIKTNRKHMLFEICWIYAAHQQKFINKMLNDGVAHEDIANLLNTINLQGNEGIMSAILLYVENCRSKGIENAELVLLEDKQLRESFFPAIKE